MHAGEIVLRRMAVLPPLMIGMALIVFLISNLLPGDVMATHLGEMGSRNPEIAAAFRERWDLDKPLHVRFLTYTLNLVRGDLGTSIKTQEPVARDIVRYFPASVELTLLAMMFSVVVGIPLGIVSAVKRNHPFDHIARLLSLVGVSGPVFWTAIVGLQIFYAGLRWLPGPGRLDTGMQEPIQITGLYTVDSLLQLDFQTFGSALRHLALPGLVLGGATMGLITRLTRSSLLEVLGQDYVRTARSKGLSETIVIVRHAMRNALMPTVTAVGLSTGLIMSRTVLVESIFAWPGIGRYAYDAVISLDFPAVAGATLAITMVFVLSNLAVDVIYTFIDPRLKNTT